MKYLLNEQELLVPPRIRKIDDNGEITDALLGVELANAYLLELYDWQADVICSWLAKKEDGKYLHPTGGLLLPRQNGKTKGVIGARMLIGAVFYGEKIRYSAHRVDTMLEMWEIFINLFGDPRIKWCEFPELHDLVKRISLQNGHLFIALKNGGVINFVARSTGSGRGNTVDVNINDEAQYMTELQLSSSLPSQSASPSGNPQNLYIGTPPDFVEATGEVFGRVRDNALKGNPGISWHEWSVETIGDVSDKTRWYATNPSLGRSLLLSAVENEYNNMSPESFAIERLGYWGSRDSIQAINYDYWEQTMENNFTDAVGKYSVGIKFAPNGKQVSVSIGVLLPDGSTYCELVENKVDAMGKTWLVNWITERKDKINFVAIDGKSGAGELHDALVSIKGISPDGVKLMSMSDVITAATMLNSALEEKTIKHPSGKVIDESAKNATKRKIGTDGYGFGGNSIPLESLSFANWAARTTKRTSIGLKKMRVI